jgi:hypothetical protein
VIATNATTTGEATALYLADALRERAPEVAVTRPPAGDLAALDGPQQRDVGGLLVAGRAGDPDHVGPGPDRADRRVGDRGGGGDGRIGEVVRDRQAAEANLAAQEPRDDPRRERARPGEIVHLVEGVAQHDRGGAGLERRPEWEQVAPPQVLE